MSLLLQASRGGVRDWIWKLLPGPAAADLDHHHQRRRGEDRRFRRLGITYPVKTTDTVVVFDSSLTTQAQPVADLAAGTYIGEEHSFIWYGWGNIDTPPLIQGGAGVLMMPYAGMRGDRRSRELDDHHDARRLHHVQVDGRLRAQPDEPPWIPRPCR